MKRFLIVFVIAFFAIFGISAGTLIGFGGASNNYYTQEVNPYTHLYEYNMTNGSSIEFRNGWVDKPFGFMYVIGAGSASYVRLLATHRLGEQCIIAGGYACKNEGNYTEFLPNAEIMFLLGNRFTLSLDFCNNASESFYGASFCYRFK